MYYFLRSSYRINDFLHVRSLPSVSAGTLVRHLPTRASQIGSELLVLITTLGIAMIILAIVRIGPSKTHRSALNGIAGTTELFAMPAMYLYVLKSTWQWHSVSTSRPYGFWRCPLLSIFAGEIVGAAILFLINRIRPLSAWSLGILVLFHYAFWIFVLWPPSESGFTAYQLFTPYLLISIGPFTAFVWLLYLRKFAHRKEAKVSAGVKMHIVAAAAAAAVLALIWVSAKDATLANSANFESFTVVLERAPCFGSCPAYSLTIHGDGSVDYLGYRNVKISGHQTAAVSTGQVMKVLQSLDRARFMSLEDRAFGWCFDTGSVAVSVSTAGKTKQVVSDDWCIGAKSGLQSKFVESAAEIDKIMDSARWVGQ